MKKYLYLILFFLICVPAIAGTINSYTLKSPPDDADTIVIYDSDDGSTKKTTVGDISSGGVAASGWTDGGSNVYLTTSTDSVGIGTHTPSSKLQVSGSVTATTYIGDGSALTGISSGGWSDNGTTIALTTSTDKVGIGTTIPISALDTGTGLITSPSIANDSVFNVKKYGAVGDGIMLFDGTITSGTDDFTSASATFTSADVGKVITIRGAGGSNIDLTTTISAYVDAHSVTLTDNASATVSSDDFTYGTDDTTAIRAAMTAIGTNSTIGKSATLFFPAGTYIVNGAFDQSNSSQIAFPLNAFANPVTSITIRGATATAPNGVANNGSIIFGTRNGASGSDSILSVTDAGGGGTGNISRINVVFENIRFRTVQDPYHTAVNLEDADQAQGINVVFDTTSDGSYLPTHSGSFALKLPGMLAGNVSGGWTNLKIKYYRSGVQLGEHSLINSAFIVSGVNALVFKDCRYPAQVIQVSIESIQNAVVVTSAGSTTSYFRIHDLDLEHNSGTFATSYDLLDASNLGVGEINYSIFDNGGGDTLLVSGAKYISRHRIETNQMEYRPTTGDHFRLISPATDSTTSGGGYFAMQNDGSAVGAGTRLGFYGFGGAYSADNEYVYGGSIQGVATETYTASAAGMDMIFRTAQTGSTTVSERLRIANNGNVGIGTTTPNSLLQVGATNSSAFRITSGGNVGIGTTAPGATLDIGTGNLRVGIGTTTAGTVVCVKSISGGTSILGYCTGSLTNSICGTCN